MFYCIQGTVMHLTPNQVVIQAGNFGIEVKISLHTFAQIQPLTHCQLYTYLEIDTYALYGFMHLAEKASFMELIE